MFSSYQTAILYLADYWESIDNCAKPNLAFAGNGLEKECRMSGAVYMVHKIYAVDTNRVYNDVRKVLKMMAEE